MLLRFTILTLFSISTFTQAQAYYKISAWGRNFDGQTTVPQWVRSGNPIYVDGGQAHTVGLFDNGMMFAFGANNFGQSHIITRAELTALGATEVLAVRAGNNHTIALLNNNKIVGFGDSANGKTATITVPAGYSVIGLDAGENQNMILLRSNSTSAYVIQLWGGGSSGPANGSYAVNTLAGTGTLTTDVGSLSAGLFEHLFTYDRAAPNLRSGLIGDLNAGLQYNLPSDYPTTGYSTVRSVKQLMVALRNGYLYAWGPNPSDPKYFGDFGIYDSLAAGAHHIMLLESSTELIYYVLMPTFATNNDGQMNTPSDIFNGGVKFISAGWSHSLALSQTASPPPAPTNPIRLSYGSNQVTLNIDPLALHTGWNLLEQSTDFVNWSAMFSGPITTTQITVPATGRRFFRLKRSAGILTLDQEEKRNLLSINRRIRLPLN